MQNLLPIVIIIPIVFGIILKLTRLAETKAAKLSCFLAVLINSVIVWVLLFYCTEKTFGILYYSERINVGLRMDGLGKIFAGMVSFLWPIALIYSFVYMKHDEKKYDYISYYIMTYGVVLGIAFSSNALTMYVFYEILTVITLPLIVHTQTKEARKAGRYYLYYSLSGSSLALAGIVMIIIECGSCNFTVNGIVEQNSTLMSLAYLFMFFGFGVKAAVFPLCRWLPMASAAPTPTTALLHAVAVVKSGAFAIMRATYYIYTGSILNGSVAQQIAMVFVIITIVYGSSKALKEQHFKRRFAYSTVANLSYILFGCLLCTKAGLQASLLHFLYHSVTKIGIFFCCGAIIETTGAQYVYQLNGMGKKMPAIFTFFTVSGLSLIGVPLFAGFVSKYYLIQSAFENGSIAGTLGIGAIILSAVLTSLYVLTVPFRAFARKPIEECASLSERAVEPSSGFLSVTGLFAVLAVLFGVWSGTVIEVIQRLTEGIC